MPDTASQRWSYYAARLRNAAVLSKDKSMEFSGTYTDQCVENRA